MANLIIIKDIKWIFVNIYCRSSPLNKSPHCVSTNNLEYFPDCSSVVHQICRLINKDNTKLYTEPVKKLMREHKCETRWTEWPDKCFDNRYGCPLSVAILSKYKKADVDLFLDILIGDLTQKKLYKMKLRKFKIVIGIFSELGIEHSHPLYLHMILRQIDKKIIMPESLWKLIHSYLIE